MVAVVQLICFTVLSALLGAAVLFHRAPSLEHLVPPPVAEKDIADLAETISQVVIKQAGRQTVDESEINQFLNSTLAAHQSGLTEGWVAPQRILCDLMEDSARLHFIWSIGSFPVHAAVDMKIAREGENLVFDITGGHYGSLRVPRLLLSPLRAALDGLAEACQPEIQALLTLPRLSVVKEKLVLDPTF